MNVKMFGVYSNHDYYYVGAVVGIQLQQGRSIAVSVPRV